MRAARIGWMRRSLQLALLLFVVLGLSLANRSLSAQVEGGYRLLGRWLAVRQWVDREVNPYDPQNQRAAQRLYYGRPAEPAAGEDPLYVLDPLPPLAVYLPLAGLPFETARTIWLTLSEVCIGLTALLSVRTVSPRPSRALLILFGLFGVGWFHGFRALIAGESHFLVAALISGALLAMQRDQFALAGVLLALSTAAPQFTLPLLLLAMIYSISRRKWALVWGALATLGLSLLVSLVIIPDWPIWWIQHLIGYFKEVRVQSAVTMLADRTPGPTNWVALGLYGLAASYLLWEWLQARGRELRWFLWSACLTLAITCMLAVEQISFGCVILLPAFYIGLAWWEQRWKLLGLIGAAAFLLGLAGAQWAIYSLGPAVNSEGVALRLLAPGTLLLILWWLRWWATSTREFRAGPELPAWRPPG